MRCYYYLFYRFYVAVRLSGEKEDPHIAATVLMTIMEMTLAFLALFLLSPSWLKSLTVISQKWLMAAAVAICFFIPNYFLLLRKNRYKDIVKMYAPESRGTVVVGSVLTILALLAITLLTVSLSPHE